MPRPKKISTEQTLDRATRHFWEQGFADSSLEALEKATGVDRKGLYNEFGNKVGLLASCLHHYRVELIAPYLSPLEQSDAGLSVVVEVFSELALEWADDFPAGCLVCNVSREEVSNEPEVASEVAAYWNMCVSRFAHGLANAKGAREIDDSIDVDAAAMYLLTVLQGFCVMETSGIDFRSAPTIVQLALAGLRC